jgi:hypothetical protein
MSERNAAGATVVLQRSYFSLRYILGAQHRHTEFRTTILENVGNPSTTLEDLHREIDVLTQVRCCMIFDYARQLYLS